jgi:hypothetical protein
MGVGHHPIDIGEERLAERFNQFTERIFIPAAGAFDQSTLVLDR